MNRKALYALLLILIVSLTLVGYESYIIRQQEALIQDQSIKILEQQRLIEQQKAIMILQNGTIVSLNISIQDLKSQLLRSEEEKSSLEASLRKYKPERPTLEQLRIFLRDDRTNEKPYIEGVYVCSDYAIDLRMSARQAGWNLSVVFVWWKTRGYEFGHALNAVYLSDGGLVWIEPEYDMVYFGSIERALEEIFYTGEWYTINPKIVELVIIW